MEDPHFRLLTARKPLNQCRFKYETDDYIGNATPHAILQLLHRKSTTAVHGRYFICVQQSLSLILNLVCMQNTEQSCYTVECISTV